MWSPQMCVIFYNFKSLKEQILRSEKGLGDTNRFGGLDCFSKWFLKKTARIRECGLSDSGSLHLLPVSETRTQAGTPASPWTTDRQVLGLSLEHCPWNQVLKNFCLASMPDLGSFYY